MSKIGVCCEYNHRNYGSMLQAFATIEKLEDLGYDYEIIRYSKKLTLGLFIRSVPRIPHELRKKLKSIKRKYDLLPYPNIRESIERRKEYFDNFQNSKFTKLSKVCNSFKELRELSKKYRLVLVGSDQLWDPVGYTTGFYTLLFVDDSVPKVSYATSFGVSDIPRSKRKKAKQFLIRYKDISVREVRGVELVKNVSGREAKAVVDPTLLYTGEEWLRKIPEKKIIENKYIFCYFLGKNEKHRDAAKKLAKETGLKIVFLPHLDDFNEKDLVFGDIHLYNVGPEEFVNLIRGAEYVCTDSFHGSVFSILNHKKFMTFNRFMNEDSNSRNSRIDSLLGQVGLESRRYKDDIMKILEDVDYVTVDEKLNVLRSSSVDFLVKSIQ